MSENEDIYNMSKGHSSVAVYLKITVSVFLGPSLVHSVTSQFNSGCIQPSCFGRSEIL